MSGVHQGWLVAKRELKERSRSRAFLVSLVVMVVAVVGVIALPSIIDTSGGQKDVGVSGTSSPALATALVAQGDAAGTKLRVHNYGTLAEGEQAVRDGKVDLLIVDGSRLETQKRPDANLKALVTAAIQITVVRQRADAVGVSDSQLGTLLAPVPLTRVELGRVAGRSPDDETAAFVMTVLLFMTIATYGAMVLNGVVEEKASRVVEVLLARIPARNLLAGKITGIGLLGLGQVAITAVAAFVAATTIGGVDLPAVRGSVLAWAVVWFILGYALYATVFGALGSLASRPEDAQSVAGPVSVVLVLVYFISFAAIGSPDTAWARAVSWIPLIAPIAMPARVAMGAAGWWEPLAASALTAAAIAGLVILGGRIYATAVLHNGPTLKVRDVWQRTAHREPRPSTRGHRHERKETDVIASSDRRKRAIVVALAGAVVVGGLVGVLTADAIVGIAVGAALFAIIDRAGRLWGGPAPR